MSQRLFSDEVTPLGVNAYVVSDEESADAVVIDPGEFSDAIADHIRDLGLHVRLILNTHGHFDHIGGNSRTVSATGAPLACHRFDAPMLSDAMLNGAMIFGDQGFVGRAPDRLIEDGETIEAGALRIGAIHTPGHSPGGLCFLIGERLFSGDTLFAGGIGRFDLPGSDGEALLRSIRERLLVLPEETPVHPGHGPATTIGEEKQSNPFVGA